MTEGSVPLGLWTSSPTHNITSVLTTPQDTVATGSFSGEVCLWKLNKHVCFCFFFPFSPSPSVVITQSQSHTKHNHNCNTTNGTQEKRLDPTFLLVGPGTDTASPVVALQPGTVRAATGAALPVVVSLTRNAQLRVWTCDDGLCVGECRDVAKVMDVALCLAVCTPPRGTSVAVVGGASQYVCFVDVATRQVLATCRVHNDWISHIAAVFVNRTMAPTFVTSSNDGTISLWTAPLHYNAATGTATGTADAEVVALSCANVDAVYSDNGAGGSARTPAGPSDDAGGGSSSGYDAGSDSTVMELLADAMSTRRRVVGLALSADAALVAVVFPGRIVVLATDSLRHLCTIVPPAPLGMSDATSTSTSSSGSSSGDTPASEMRGSSGSDEDGSTTSTTTTTSEAPSILQRDPLYRHAMCRWGGATFVDGTTLAAWTQLGIGCVYGLGADVPAASPSPSPPPPRSPRTPRTPSPPPAPVPVPVPDRLAPQLLFCTEPPALASTHRNTLSQPSLKFFGWCAHALGRRLSLANGDTLALYELPRDGTDAAERHHGGSHHHHHGDGDHEDADGVRVVRGARCTSSMAMAMSGMAESPSSFGVGFSHLAARRHMQLPSSSSSSSSSSLGGTEDAEHEGRRRRALFSEAVRPALTGTFSAVWQAVGAEWKSVTSLCLLEDLFVLICGHADGVVSCHTLPSDASPKRFRAHEKKVTALYSPRPQAGDRWRVVVSASDDFTIKVWRLFSFELHYCFNIHSGSVLHLVPFTAPPMPSVAAATVGSNISSSSSGGGGGGGGGGGNGGAGVLVDVDTTSLYRNSIMSIGADRCVAVFDLDKLECQHWLPGHYSPIVDVRWKVEQGYVMVSCLDSTLFVWELASNTLVCKLSGDPARMVLSNYCLKVFSAREGYQSMPPIDDVGISAGALRVGEPRAQGCPILCVVLADTAQLFDALNSHGTSPFMLSRRFAWSDTGSGLLPPATPGQQPQQQQKQPRDGRCKVVTYRYPPLSMLAYFFPWGVDADADALARRDMLLKPPAPLFSPGLLGEGGNCSFALPVTGRGGARLSALAFSPRYTARTLLTGLTMLKLLARVDTLAATSRRLQAAFLHTAPAAAGTDPADTDAADTVDTSTIVEPSVEVLAGQMNAALSCAPATARVVPSDVAASARELVARALGRQSTTAINTAIAEHQRMLVVADHALTAAERGMLVAVLALMLCDCGARIDASVARFITERLVDFVAADAREPRPFYATAVDALVRGLPQWRRLVDDPRRPLRHLFATAISSTATQIEVQAAQRAFFALGRADPSLFMAVLGSEVSERRNQAGALAALGHYVGRWNTALCEHLPSLAEITVSALDPATPAVRDRCIRPATAVIQRMISNYPMVAFHQDSQRLAVGTSTGFVLFDIKTGQSAACRTHAWVAALAFSPTGKSVATYSADNRLALWQVSGIVSTLKLLAKNKTPDWVFTPDRPDLAPTAPTNTIKVFWEAPGTLVLTRASSSSYRVSVSKSL